LAEAAARSDLLFFLRAVYKFSYFLIYLFQQSKKLPTLSGTTTYYFRGPSIFAIVDFCHRKTVNSAIESGGFRHNSAMVEKCNVM